MAVGRVAWAPDCSSVVDRCRAGLQVYFVAKQCSQRCTPEEYAIALAKHYVSTYPKVRIVGLFGRDTADTSNFATVHA